MHLRRLVCTFALLTFALPLSADVSITRGSKLSVSAASDGRLAIDVLGELWIVPGSGGEAQQLTQDLRSAEKPRWSPDASQLVFQSSVDGRSGIWLIDIVTRATRKLSNDTFADVQPVWHPSGERIAFASARNGSDLDLWEIDLATGLHWRLSHADGDETEPAWSADGRDLAYIRYRDKHWSLVLRRFGASEETLAISGEPLSAPAFRPDGSLITYLQSNERGRELKMVILSRPRLIRSLAEDSFEDSPISWLDRHNMIYAADGRIRKRLFGAWSADTLSFRASVAATKKVPRNEPRPELQWQDEPQGELIIHAARLYDGLGNEYQEHKDIVMRGGKIAAIGVHQRHDGKRVIDMGDLAIVPGLIDADARLPTHLGNSHGPDLLTTGVTTVVALHNNTDALETTWSGKEIPGPRLLSADRWTVGPLMRPELDVTAAVSTSRSTGLISGAALTEQFSQLARAGLTPAQTLRAVGVNAAAVLRADPFLGRIAVGASADLVFVDGDPLADISDMLNVVAIVRNGRFYSVSGLIDRAKAAESVE